MASPPLTMFPVILFKWTCAMFSLRNGNRSLFYLVDDMLWNWLCYFLNDLRPLSPSLLKILYASDCAMLCLDYLMWSSLVTTVELFNLSTSFWVLLV